MVYIVTEGGYFVSQDHEYIAEIIQDYDPSLRLAWIPPDKREPGDRAFAVIHTQLDGQEYIALYADECDHRILERLWAADNTKHNVMLETDLKNAAIKAIEYKREMVEKEERDDLAKSIFKSPLNVYRHGGQVYRD